MARGRGGLSQGTDVLVVGAGPAGLTAAIALGRAGAHVTLVERRTALSPFPRATGVSLRTMELLRAWGLEDKTVPERVAAATSSVCWSQGEKYSVPPLTPAIVGASAENFS